MPQCFIPSNFCQFWACIQQGVPCVSYVQNQLSVESTWALLYLGAWSKLGIINKDDIKAVASLPDAAKGEEEMEDEFDIVL